MLRRGINARDHSLRAYHLRAAARFAPLRGCASHNEERNLRITLQAIAESGRKAIFQRYRCLMAACYHAA